METTSQHGVASFLAQADAVGLVVLTLLVLMSIACWYLIAVKALRGWQARRSTQAFVAGYWNTTQPEELHDLVQSHGNTNAFARLTVQALEVRCHHHGRDVHQIDDKDLTEILIRSLRGAITRETATLESGLTVLASVASTAPFIGLFGTVWGIYHALIGIGMSGAATLDAVAGPVGEALIMTAAGLAVAIPAVLAFNGFTRANRVALVELDGFAHDLLVFLVGGHQPGARRPDKAAGEPSMRITPQGAA